MDLRNYVLIDLNTGTVIRDPRRVRLVHDENVPEWTDDLSMIAAADNFGLSLEEYAEGCE